MPRAKKSSAWVEAPMPTQDEPIESGQEELSTSHQEQGTEVTFNPPIQPQLMSSMFMPYIEGPKMDCTVNNGLYNSFLKWHLKCENILECNLAALPEKQWCKKVIAWSGDFSMDRYVSWSLPTDQLTLEVIWGRFEEFCKPQSNEVPARFNLLTSFGQGNEKCWWMV